MTNLKVGDNVVRNICGLKMRLTVTAITDDIIECGDWTFDRHTGMEIDEELGWGNAITGSYLEKENCDQL